VKVENILRVLILTANVVLTLAYAGGWTQHWLAAQLHAPSAFKLHLSSAGIAVMLTMFCDLSVMFYFIGTGMWIRDRARETVALDKDRAFRIWSLYEKANKLKGKSFPFASMGLVFGIFTFVIGGAVQIGAVPGWLHPLLATLLLLNEWAGIRFVLGALTANVVLLDQASAELDQAS